jgi:hypothetical protein
MTDTVPTTDLDPRYSSPGAVPTPWAEGRDRLEQAEIYWLSTVRQDGRPHVTPVAAVWLDDALAFATGPGERKAKNLETNRNCIMTTGSNALGEGLDVVVEGDAVRVLDQDQLQRVADAFDAKYPGAFHFDLRQGGFVAGGGGEAIAFEVRPTTAFGFGRGDGFSQTRWRFF